MRVLGILAMAVIILIVSPAVVEAHPWRWESPSWQDSYSWDDNDYSWDYDYSWNYGYRSWDKGYSWKYGYRSWKHRQKDYSFSQPYRLHWGEEPDTPRWDKRFDCRWISASPKLGAVYTGQKFVCGWFEE